MLKSLLWLPFFVAITPAAALDCSDLKPTPPNSESTSFTGKVDASVDGFYAKLAYSERKIDRPYNQVDKTYSEVAKNVLTDLPAADKSYIWKRVLFLNCQQLTGRNDVTVENKLKEIGHLYSKFGTAPPPITIDQTTSGSLSPANEGSGNNIIINPGTGVDYAVIDSGYEFLYPGIPERIGYGLYTYVLLTPARPDRNKAVIDAIEKYTPNVAVFSHDISRVNIIYVPSKSPKKDATAPSAMEYDFDRSRSLIAIICAMPSGEIGRVCKGGLSLGPYMFTYASPLNKDVKLSPPVLFVDLTPIQEGAFATFIDAYKEQIKSKDIGDGQKLQSLYIKILNIIETAKLWVDPIEHATADVIHLISSAKQ